MFSFRNAAVIILAQLTVVKVALKIIIVSSLKVHSKELGGCGHFVDKAKSCWPLLPLCPPVLLFVLLLLLLLHHHLYTVSTASHVTGVLSANNQRLIILTQHLVLPCHASALLLCVLARGPVGGYSIFFLKASDCLKLAARVILSNVDKSRRLFPLFRSLFCSIILPYLGRSL